MDSSPHIVMHSYIHGKDEKKFGEKNKTTKQIQKMQILWIVYVHW